MIAVADASPLIGLSKARRLNLLRVLYGSVLIPPQVYADVVVQGRGRAGARAAKNAVSVGWLRVVPVAEATLVPPEFAGTGEGEAMALCREQQADVLLVDDRAARNAATRLGLRWLTTGGILLDARQAGAIRRVRPILDRMQAKGFGVAGYEEILHAAQEAP